MRLRYKRAIALLVSRVPTRGARIALYRALLGYRFGRRCRLGYGVQLAVDAFEAGDGVVIRRHTVFQGPITVVLGDRTFIGRFNQIECGDGAAAADVEHMNYTRRFQTGADSLINERHLFDVLGTVRIGRGSWVAGFASQFLTHGASVQDRDISIGEECFIGSAARFAPGSGVADRVIVAMGAVVTKRLPICDVVVAGLPAKVIKSRQDPNEYRFARTW